MFICIHYIDYHIITSYIIIMNRRNTDVSVYQPIRRPHSVTWQTSSAQQLWRHHEPLPTFVTSSLYEFWSSIYNLRILIFEYFIDKNLFYRNTLFFFYILLCSCGSFLLSLRIRFGLIPSLLARKVRVKFYPEMLISSPQVFIFVSRWFFFLSNSTLENLRMLPRV